MLILLKKTQIFCLKIGNFSFDELYKIKKFKIKHYLTF